MEKGIQRDKLWCQILILCGIYFLVPTLFEKHFQRQQTRV